MEITEIELEKIEKVKNECSTRAHVYIQLFLYISNCINNECAVDSNCWHWNDESKHIECIKSIQLQCVVLVTHIDVCDCECVNSIKWNRKERATGAWVFYLFLSAFPIYFKSFASSSAQNHSFPNCINEIIFTLPHTHTRDCSLMHTQSVSGEQVSKAATVRVMYFHIFFSFFFLCWRCYCVVVRVSDTCCLGIQRKGTAWATTMTTTQNSIIGILSWTHRPLRSLFLSLPARVCENHIFSIFLYFYSLLQFFFPFVYTHTHGHTQCVCVVCVCVCLCSVHGRRVVLVSVSVSAVCEWMLRSISACLCVDQSLFGRGVASSNPLYTHFLSYDERRLCAVRARTGTPFSPKKPIFHSLPHSQQHTYTRTHSECWRLRPHHEYSNWIESTNASYT